MPSNRWVGKFTPAELRRRLPRRADRRAVVVAEFLDSMIAGGATWFPTPAGDAIIIKNGRAFILRFHAGEGRPTDADADASLTFERSGARVATVRDLTELTNTLTAWGLRRRPLAA